MRAATKTAPAEVQLDEGQDRNTYQENQTMQKTTAPRLACAPDNEELASSRDSVLVPCDDDSCAFFHQGHFADRVDPLFIHLFIGVTEPEFRVAVERLCTDDRWELSVEVLREDMGTKSSRRFARVLVRCSEIAERLNEERCA